MSVVCVASNFDFTFYIIIIIVVVYYNSINILETRAVAIAISQNQI
jgi:hypothetical protein